MFSCTPSEMMEQDPEIIQGVIEAINAESAVKKMSATQQQGGGGGSMNQSEVDIYAAMLAETEG